MDVKERNPVLVLVLAIVTFGIYGIYWFYTTTKEMVEASGKNSSPVLWTIGLFIPIVNIIMFWKHAHLLEEVTGEHSGIPVFLLWLVFSPAALYISQVDLNTLVED